MVRQIKMKWVAVVTIIVVVIAGAYFFACYQLSKSVKSFIDAKIKQISPAYIVTYKSISSNPLTDKTTIRDLNIKPAGQTDQPPVTIRTVVIGLNETRQGVLTHFSAELNGLIVPVDQQLIQMPVVFQLAKQLTTNGFVNNVSVEYRYQPRQQRAEVDFMHQLEQLGTLNFHLVIGNFSPGRQSLLSLQAISVVSLTMSYKDDSLLPRVFTILAQQAGMTKEQYVQQFIAKVQAAAATEPSPLYKQVLTQFAAFCQNPSEFKITATPAQPVTLGQLRVLDKEQVVNQLNVQVVANTNAVPVTTSAPTLPNGDNTNATRPA